MWEPTIKISYYLFPLFSCLHPSWHSESRYVMVIDKRRNKFDHSPFTKISLLLFATYRFAFLLIDLFHLSEDTSQHLRAHSRSDKVLILEEQSYSLGKFPCSSLMHVCVLLSHVELFMTLWTVACQVPPSMAFSRQEYWSGLPIPAPCSSRIVVSCSVGGCEGHVENLDYP